MLRKECEENLVEMALCFVYGRIGSASVYRKNYPDNFRDNDQ